MVDVFVPRVTAEHSERLTADPNTPAFHVRGQRYFYTDRRCDRCRGAVQIYMVPHREWAGLGYAENSLICIKCLTKRCGGTIRICGIGTGERTG